MRPCACTTSPPVTAFSPTSNAVPHGALYALSQGDSPGDVAPGSPALPNSGRLLAVNRHGGFAVLLDKLNLPTSLDFLGKTAFVTTLAGDVWRIKHVSTRGAARCESHRD